MSATEHANRPVVSVCIANYNGEPFVRECIDSVLGQTHAPSFEIIVHDDASTDRSIEQIACYDKVHLIRSADNVGYCVANNRMASAARGQYLLLLNNDAVLQPDALCTLMESAIAIDAPAIMGLRQYDYFSGEFIDAGAWLDVFMSPIPIKRDEATHPAMVIGACLWIPRALWNELGDSLNGSTRTPRMFTFAARRACVDTMFSCRPNQAICTVSAPHSATATDTPTN